MAIAPQRVGIGIRRQFTTEGVHPYDEVRWERRDARITNFRDGTVAFEQLGVEVPDFWSVNATNILAQKYFRGSLGTPEREWSLKQVADRVVDTITAWGVKDGYFVDDAEAELFNHELKHLIIHQKAAFNSPVWFNIGVKDVPQQGSACQPFDALVSTPDGLVPIGQLVEDGGVGTKVFDATGVTRVVAVKHNGIKPVLRITTKSGHRLDVTGDHLVWRASAIGCGEFVRADALLPGDAVEWHRTYAEGSEELSTRAMAEAALAGWLQSDGFVGQEEGTNRSLTVEAMTVTPAEYDWVTRAFDRVLPGVHRHLRPVATKDETLDCRRIRADGNVLSDFVGRWDLRRRGTDMRVPAQLFSAPLPVVRAYLRSLFQAEGYVSVRERTGFVAMDMISEEVVRGAQSLLSRFGIFGRVRFKADARPDRHGTWCLRIQSLGDRAAFAEEIGFIDPVKASKLEATLSLPGRPSRGVKRLEIDAIEDRGEMDVYDIQTESGEYLSGGLRVHNCFILSVEDSMDSILNWYTEEGTIFKGGSGAGVNLSRIRSSHELLKGGGTASGPVSFMRGADASAGTIKSGGKCFREGTLVGTPDGLRPIEQLRVGDLVLTHEGPQPVADFMPNGDKQCYLVRTAEGYEVEVTAGHKFASWNVEEGRYDVKPIEAFAPGDTLHVLLAASDGGAPISLLPPEMHDPAHATTTVDMRFPTEMDDRLGYMLGVMYGDAELRTEYPYRVRVAFDKDEAGAVSAERFCRWGEELFGERPLLLADHSGHQQIGYTRKRFVDFLRVNGLAKGKGHDLGFPDLLFLATPDVRAAFVAGFIDADGCYQRRGGWQITSIDRAFLVRLQRLLLSLGVPSKVKLSREARGSWQPLYRLTVVGSTFVDRLAECIRPYSAKAQVTYAPSAGADKGWGYRPSLLAPLRARVERRGGAVTVERSVGTNETSGYRAVATLERHPDAAVARYAHDVCTTVQVTLASVTPTEVARTYDIEVSGTHLLAANGIYASNTRRAAKMVILDVDHPDIEDFIWCKAIEERKARVLRDAGFDMDLDGADSHSTQYQNANNSVRVTDEFMQAVLDGRDWDLVARTDGSVVRRVPARDLFRQIAHSAWECADPGMQFDTTINRWHTAPVTGRINGSNPCFPGSAVVHTDKGLVPFTELFERANRGEEFGIYTHDATNVDQPVEQALVSSAEAFMITGYNDIVRLTFDNGAVLRCTPTHRIFTVNRGYVPANQLVFGDEVKLLDVAAPAVNADAGLPVSSDQGAYMQKGDHADPLTLPEEWSEEFAHYLGWLVGDGSISGSTVSTIYGSAEDRTEILPEHAELLARINGGRTPKTSEQPNGTAQLRMSRRPYQRFLEALGLRGVHGPEKSVPWSIEQAPSPIVASFLRGLFDADGCAVANPEKGSSVQLGSSSPTLLRRVQVLLSTFGIHAKIYRGRGPGEMDLPYTRASGETVTYRSHRMHTLRISSESVEGFAEHIGFRLSRKAAALREILTESTRYHVRTTAHLLERVNDGIELTYNLSEPRNHSYVVDGVVVRNCSEYMHLDNSACNLASLNLLKFLGEDGTFDVEGFRASVAVVFTGQEIIVGNADYPTEKIAENSRRFRELGIGYANLGALLMAQGLPYDSDEGRAWAGAITALMTGHAYATSARTAARMGPFAGYHDNAEAMVNVLRMHQEETAHIDEDLVPTEVLSAAQRAWDEAVELAEEFGVRNSQASVLAPTGCLVGGSLVTTERGLVRLQSLGDPFGEKWQDLDLAVGTDEGPRQATKFFVNGLEPVVTVETSRGHRIAGTPTHRVKVVDPETGEWQWRRLADVREGDVVPMAQGTLVGGPNRVPLPPLADAYWTGEHSIQVPSRMNAALAEVIGYFMGDGSLHSRGLRFCVTAGDFDVSERLTVLLKDCFGAPVKTTAKKGYTEVRVDSVRLAQWWEACRFAKRAPHDEHRGKGYQAHLPDAVLHSNDPEVYRAFLRGLYEADGDTGAGYPTLENTSIEMLRDVQTLSLALGFPTTLKVHDRPGGDSWGTSPIGTVRLLNAWYSLAWRDEIGFMGDRKNAGIKTADPAIAQTGRHDYVPLTRGTVDRLVPENGRMRRLLLQEIARGRVTRRAVEDLHGATNDPELGHLLAFSYDTVASATLGEEELTFDLSVPGNVTYLANGFVSHNTIGLLMDCDTTGVEPDLGLVKTKKLVGGGTMSIVNQTVPRALSQLGYSAEQVDAIVAHIDEHKSIVGAPHLSDEHLPVFACSMGDNTIHYLGHVKMMGAVQPFISGAISKTVNMPEAVTVEDVEQLHIDAWKLGIKAVAIYRDNCKVAQPLSTTKKEGAAEAEGGDTSPPGSEAEAKDRAIAARIAELEAALALEKKRESEPVVVGAIRERLPRRRNSKTFSFRVADCEGYVTVGEYEDGRPGEVFIKVSKQGSTLAGIMDAFAISISLGLQHQVPLATYVRKYSNMKFEPSGITDDADLRIATSLVDYIFRRMALDYLSYEDRLDLGVLSTSERTQPTLPGVEESATPNVGITEVNTSVGRPAEAAPDVLARAEQRDAPYCYSCGNVMQRAGSCYVCSSCGTTSGCS